eukprot:1154239-Pelagomonas_calceolata.AAC.16
MQHYSVGLQFGVSVTLKTVLLAHPCRLHAQKLDKAVVSGKNTFMFPQEAQKITQGELQPDCSADQPVAGLRQPIIML